MTLFEWILISICFISLLALQAYTEWCWKLEREANRQEMNRLRERINSVYAEGMKFGYDTILEFTKGLSDKSEKGGEE